MTTFGELKIVASQEIGQLGPKEGEAVIYNWKWYYNVLRSLLWLGLIPLLVVVKGNRNPRAWLIFIPLVIVNLCWSIFTRFLGTGSISTAMFSVMFHSLAVGIAALWLLGHKIGNRNRFVTFLLALAIMAVAALAGVISYGMTDFSGQAPAILMFLAVLAFTMLLAFVLTGWRCRNRYGNLRFMLWLALWCVVTCVASMFVFILIMFAAGGVPISIFALLLSFLAAGLIFGLCAYVILLPYMILAFRSSFFRQRFYGCFRLPAMAKLSTGGSAADASKQNNISEPGGP